jgi:triacylglycerol lipase
MLQSAWIPVVNMVSANGVRKECEALRIQLERRELPPSQMCATRYPLLLVHGIFFRDWPNFNYWGRIPERLLNNGATIYYGNQQSADTVQDSAAELAAEIARITAETGCEKVNIIAHSKGGLDARYAISQLGMADKVASLTTVNTPHRGCNYARKLMERIPSAAINAMDGRYEAIFTRLGDPDPNFLGGIVDLTDTECARLNALMPDAPGVRYQSVGSQIESVFAIGFPFNIGYSLIYPIEGPNDGLVATSSMAWGDFLGIVTSTEKKGISHADMIDLTRKDVPGFDVCGFYQTLVAELKSRGL